MKTSYTTKELAKVISQTDRSVNRRAKRECWPSESRKGRGGGKVWILKGLPEDVRAAITLHEAKRDVPALPSDNVMIPDWAHSVGMARFRVVSEWRQYVAKSKETKGKATEAFLLGVNSGLLLPKEYDVLGEVSDKTLYRWDKKLRDNDDDYRILCDRQKRHRPAGRIRRAVLKRNRQGR